jgi:hypothetical protein
MSHTNLFTTPRPVAATVPCVPTEKIVPVSADEVARQSRFWCVLILRRAGYEEVSDNAKVYPKVSIHLQVASIGYPSGWHCFADGAVGRKRACTRSVDDWDRDCEVDTYAGSVGESYHELASRLLADNGSLTKQLDRAEVQIVERFESIARLG